MADLNVKVLKRSLKSAAGVDTIGVGVVARLRRLDGKGGEISHAVSIGERETPISGLDAGSYEVQLHMPSGTVLTQQVDVGGEPATLEFDAGGSPAPHLGWQHLSGAVPNRKAAGTRFGTFVSPRGNIPKIDVPPDLGEDVGSEAEAHYQRGSSASPFSAGERPRVLVIEAPSGIEHGEIAPTRLLETWRLLREGVQRKTKPIQMVRGFHRRTQAASAQDDVHQSWRFGFAHSADPGKRPARPYAWVNVEGADELVSLPLPWRTVGNDWNGTDCVDLLVDVSNSNRAMRSSVTVHDEMYGGLLAYMNTGSIGLAAELLRDGTVLRDRALEFLRSGDSCPLGTCAAAYALIATSGFSEPEEIAQWNEWVSQVDLAGSYSWIPDASILSARVILRTAESESDAREAIAHIHRALQAGLPFYSLGLTWLIEAMSFFRSDPLIESVYESVDFVARHLDVSQAFLVLKLRTAS